MRTGSWNPAGILAKSYSGFPDDSQFVDFFQVPQLRAIQPESLTLQVNRSAVF